jgi:hypothetical protein
MRFKLTKKTNVRSFYIEKYPTDEMGENITKHITFTDVFNCLDNYEHIYELIGVGDSLVRERIFESLANVMGVSYDYIYQQWLMVTFEDIKK